MKYLVSCRTAFSLFVIMATALMLPHSQVFAASTPINLIDHGKSTYSIVIPSATTDTRQNRTLNLAANLLQSTLQKSTGAQLPIVSEENWKAATPAIYLGKTIAAQKAGLPLDKITEWTTLNVARNQNVFLVGNDATSAITGSTFEYQGTLRAVTLFLESIGVRFLMPGQTYGTFVPTLDGVAVPGDLNDRQTPYLTYFTGRVPHDDVYAAANNFLMSDVYKSFGGHSYYTAVPAAEYAKTHPEYFILKNGVRSSAGNHLTISNPTVHKLMIEQMEKYLDDGYQWIELGQTDGYIPSEDPLDVAINPDPSERTWIFHRELAEEMQKLRPGKKVVIISYGPTKNPPKSFTHFPDNVIIEMTGYSANDFKNWAPFGNIPKTVYLYNWGSYKATGFGPIRTPQYVSDEARLFHQYNVRGVYTDGNFARLGLEGPVYYVFGKMLQNPNLKWQDLTTEYYKDAFGKSVAPMTDFYNTLYSRLQLYNKVENTLYTDKEGPNKIGSTPDEIYSALYPQEVSDKLTQDLETAKTMDADPAVQARLRLVEREFDYVKLTTNVFAAYHQYQKTPDWNTFDTVEKAVNARTALIDTFYDASGTKKTIDGFPNLFGLSANQKGTLMAGGTNRGVLGDPFSWNFAELRKSQFLPGVTQLRIKHIDAIHMQPFSITGKNDNPAWQNAPQGEFVESNMRKLVNGTTFRVGYDDQNIYVAFDCTRDQMDKFNPPSAGKDGRTFGMEAQDELEVQFYLGDNHQYRFFFNPAKDSTYDGRYGFITDGLDPRYGKWDDGWDGKWNYAFNIDRANNRYTAEIQVPFSTLGIPAPKPGDTLQLRLRRVNFLYQPDLLGWSPGNSNSPVVSGWTTTGYKDFGVVTFK
jgi:hypothetical protein